MRRTSIVVASVLFYVAGQPSFAQFNSAIQGTVSDSSQGTIPDATVRVINVTTDVVRQTVTSADGLYRVLSLAPGEYKVIVEKAGFQTVERGSVTVALNETARLDFMLNVGSLSEKVTVEAAPPLVETEEGRVSGQIDSRQLQEMPLNTRNVLNLLALQPGVTGRGLSAGYGTGSPGDSFAGETAPSVYASGQRFEANNYTLDDTSVTSEARPGVTNVVPNPDAVQEVRVVSNNFSAVDGRDTGAQIQMITKPGRISSMGPRISTIRTTNSPRAMSLRRRPRCFVETLWAVRSEDRWLRTGPFSFLAMKGCGNRAAERRPLLWRLLNYGIMCNRPDRILSRLSSLPNSNR